MKPLLEWADEMAEALNLKGADVEDVALELASKVRAGLTREQAVEVVRAQADFDEEQERERSKAEKAAAAAKAKAAKKTAGGEKEPPAAGKPSDPDTTPGADKSAEGAQSA